MRSHKLRAVSKDQRGFTLLELVVGILMAAIIGSAALATLFQVIAWNSKTNTSLAATTEIESAVGWISRDVQEAQKVSGTDADYFLRLESVDWESGASNNIYYKIVGDELRRSEDSTFLVFLVVARHIVSDPADPNHTFCSELMDQITGNDTGLLKLTVKVTVGGFRPTTVTRQANVFHRTNF
ncbi:MAG: type II secretion system protein [Chloroflexi bacterium]|nr:type II secretion system protein [Chloroflexota bacterium]